jgi:PAS domain S-box-containing protein
VTKNSRVVKPETPTLKEKAAKNGLHDEISSIGLSILDIMDALPFYVLLVDEDHRIILANRAQRRKLGKESNAIIDEYCQKVKHGPNESWHACPLEEAVEKDKAVEREAYDQESGRWINSAIYPIRGFTRNGRRIFFHMVTDITDRKQDEEQLRISHKQLHNLSRHLESVREEERKKIARDLHDETSQVIASLNAHLEAAVGMLPDSKSKIKTILRRAESLSTRIYDGLQKLIYELRPSLLDDLGFIAAIRSLIENNLKAAGIKASFNAVGRVRTLPNDTETTLYRLIQEAVSNIVRHSQAKNADINIHFEERIIRVRIRDNGKGFNVEKAINSRNGVSGFGLLGLKERAELAKGTFTIQSRPGNNGTEINIAIPIN